MHTGGAVGTMTGSGATHRVLLLGGTGEARELAAVLVARGVPVISSLAGRVSSPRLPMGEVHVGGFGGAAGLAEYLRSESISAVVDATHPFAARITAHAVVATRATNPAPCPARPSPGEAWPDHSGVGEKAHIPDGEGLPDHGGVPLLVLRRPQWRAQAGDRWVRVADIFSAAVHLARYPAGARVLLTTGRQETAAFAELPQRFWLRAVEAPDGPLPEHCDIILDRGPFTLDAERELMRHMDVLVTKNSGGPMTAAKLTAAREQGTEVIMIERPPLPDGVPVVQQVAEAVDWLEERLRA
ncbi:precorrin-6A/cobalt-precorrin-6A reductase [Kineosporia sp. NBRC 101731]|uniref:precorrin-6A/cobalt-precorrin-6A reductase n=1 Tax=Kineosporia sp. NBRC 101731 TaxID=3032199 RepID=UPI0024A2F2F5|nr:precorrin-6A/cobalt-precorrin-6A reductase [Kineosporia sp. NBRC 101731]GLY33120.1 precorrin-6A reductase [Kineosporia sp. NBRC 101731]